MRLKSAALQYELVICISSSQPNRNLHQVVYSLITWNSDAIVFPVPDPMSLCLYPNNMQKLIIVSSSVPAQPPPRHRPTMRDQPHQCFAAAGSAAAGSAAAAPPRELMPAADRERTFSLPGAFWAKRALAPMTLRAALYVSRDTDSGSDATNQLTPSEHGGVVRDPE